MLRRGTGVGIPNCLIQIMIARRLSGFCIDSRDGMERDRMGWDGTGQSADDQLACGLRLS